MRPDELERRLCKRLDALGPAPRAELLRVLTLPDFDRVGAIQTYWGNPETRTFGELLIDCEEERALRAVLVGMLCEAERGRYRLRGGTVMLAQAVQDFGNSVVALILLGVQVVLLVVFVLAIVKFFQMASDVRNILQLLVSEFEARDTD